MKVLIFLLFIGHPFLAYSNVIDIKQNVSISKSSKLYIKSEHDRDYPLALYFNSNGKEVRIDKYEVNGSEPIIENLFFMDINKVTNLLVLVSWDQIHQAEEIGGKLYQVYAYSYVNNLFSPNKIITNDPKLSGVDGEFNGNDMRFCFKIEALIKRYINEKYN